MMKKKWFVGAAAAVLSAALCFTVVGCGSGGGTNAKDVTGEKVTAEQWVAAFEAIVKDDAKLTIKYVAKDETTITYTKDDGTKLTCTSGEVDTSDIVSNGSLQYVKTKSEKKAEGDYEAIAELLGSDPDDIDLSTETSESYSEKTADGYDYYDKNAENKWVKTTKSHGAASDMIEGMAESFQERYADYEYNDTLKGYVGKGYKAEDTAYTVLKFDKEGKLVAIYLVVGHDEGSDPVKMQSKEEVSCTISYTAKEIKLPQVD